MSADEGAQVYDLCAARRLKQELAEVSRSCARRSIVIDGMQFTVTTLSNMTTCADNRRSVYTSRDG